MVVAPRPKIPLKTKFKVWWEGYDIEDVEARLRALREASPTPARAAAPEPAIPHRRPVAPAMTWDADRVEIAQYIWGEGYCGPGGPDHVVSLSKLLSLSPEMSALIIGAGLGGPARVLAMEFGVWITGAEQSPELAAAGMELSTMAGLAKKAPIVHYDPAAAEPFDRNFDRVLSKDGLFTVADKGHLIACIAKKLKAQGLFLLTDYFLRDEAAAESHEYRTWRDGEPVTPYPITGDAMVALLTGNGLTVRVNEDISQHYAAMIAQAWADAGKVASALKTKGEQGRQQMDTLVREAELWSRRAALLTSGELQLRRILAVKNGAGPV